MQDNDLPVLELLPEIHKKFTEGNVVILQAPPGAGKSTGLPIKFLDAPWLNSKKMLMLEPRRLAAKTVAARMSYLMKEPLGNSIGYSVRFDSKKSSTTKLEVVTEGILTRRLQQDNFLEGIGLVIFDEFHERSIHADISFMLCREIQQTVRPDLKLLIMSATIGAADLSKHLEGAPILQSEGKQYPVELVYQEQESQTPLPLKVSKAVLYSLSHDDGDILVFLPGVGEIQRVAALLEKEDLKEMVMPLYGDMPFDDQQKVLLPHPQGKRKIILATSIAETSLTIEGIKVVIDSGLARKQKFDPNTALSKLTTQPVTKDTADQRAGRAGRMTSGKCYRLWTKHAHRVLTDHITPEVLEADLAPALLELSAWSNSDVKTMHWITQPPLGNVSQATDLLHRLGALKNGKITTHGKDMLELGLHPRLAHMLLVGKQNGKAPLAVDIASILEERDFLEKNAGADLNLRLSALQLWRNKKQGYVNSNNLGRIEKLSTHYAKVLGIQSGMYSALTTDTGWLLAEAFPERIAQQKEQKSHHYRLASGKVATMDEHDALTNEKWLAIAHMDAGEKEGKIYLAAPLNPWNLVHNMEIKNKVEWNVQKGMLVAVAEKRLEGMVVESRQMEVVPKELREEALRDAVRHEGLQILNWEDGARSFQNRIMCARQWKPNFEWPDVSEQNLLSTIQTWLLPSLNNIKKREDFYKINLLQTLQEPLEWRVREKLEAVAPGYLKVPTGSDIKLQYNADGSAPILSVRLQEMFGMLDTPTVGEGKIQVMVHLLSPGYKPVQVTQDLRSFWNTTYHLVRKELRAQYPRHYWPENPLEAEAVRGVKKKAR